MTRPVVQTRKFDSLTKTRRDTSETTTTTVSQEKNRAEMFGGLRRREKRERERDY